MTNTTINNFPPEVFKKLKYYVYRLMDPRNGETFYVGKGKDNRVFQHIKCVLASDQDELSQKLQVIREIQRAGLEVIHVIHRHGMEQNVALEVEAALIDAFPSATNIMGGQGSNDYGPMNAIEIMKRYKAEEIEFQHKVVMINVNRSIDLVSTYDAVRFAWRIDKNRASNADYVLAIEKGIVVGAFVATEWKEATKDNFPEFNRNIDGRKGFVGYEAESDIQELYLHKSIPDSYRKKGAAFPVKYSQN